VATVILFPELISTQTRETSHRWVKKTMNNCLNFKTHGTRNFRRRKRTNKVNQLMKQYFVIHLTALQLNYTKKKNGRDKPLRRKVDFVVIGN